MAKDARNPMNRTAPNRQIAFTLMELLVVIGVIAILVSVLFAGLRTGAISGRIQTTKALVSQVGHGHLPVRERLWGHAAS